MGGGVKKAGIFFGIFAAAFGFACFVAWLSGYEFNNRGPWVAYCFCVVCLVSALVAHLGAEMLA